MLEELKKLPLDEQRALVMELARIISKQLDSMETTTFAAEIETAAKWPDATPDQIKSLSRWE